MSHQQVRQLPVRRTAIALSLAAAVFAVGAANAGERERPVLSQVVADAMKRDLRLNDRQLAQYFDAEGNFRFVAGSTGSAKAANVGGIEVRPQRYSLRELNAAKAELDGLHSRTVQKSRLVGVHAWGVDVRNNRLVLTVAPGHALRAAVEGLPEFEF